MTEKLSRHQILLYAGDWQRLEAIWQNRSPTSVIRELVRQHLDRTEARIAAATETENAGA